MSKPQVGLLSGAGPMSGDLLVSENKKKQAIEPALIIPYSTGGYSN